MHNPPTPPLSWGSVISPAACSIDLRDADEDVETDPAAIGAPAAIAADGRYEILALLGEGGMGRVYKARDRRLGRIIALKVVDAATPRLRRRFAEEARAQARLDHPHACRLYEVSEIDSHPCIAMQLVDGETLRTLARRITLREKLYIVRDVARALHAAHELGIVHRDVKPGNVLVASANDRYHAYVADFGLAREVSADDATTSASMGTPAYMAPEQVRGESDGLDRRTDVWALGATLYDVIAGQTPFAGPNPMGMLLRVLTDEPAPLRSLCREAPRDVELVIAKCLEKAPDRRYATAAQVADELDRVLQGAPILARADWGYRAGKRALKYRAAVSVGLVVGILAIGGAAIVQHARTVAGDQERAARDLGVGAARLESISRRAELSPLHDTRRERAEMFEEMRRIEDGLSRVPSCAATGAYSLGRAYLALRQPARARQWLERASAAGLNDANFEAALGEALGELYRQAVAETQRVPAAMRERPLAEAAEKFRDPALTHLRAARANPAISEHAEGLVAFYERRFDDAIRQSRAAFARDALAYDAKELEGDVEYARAGELYTGGKYKEADEGYTRAGDAYQAALAIARSDATIYAKEVRRHTWQMETVRKRGQSGDAHFAQAMEMANRALTADPDDARAHRARAEAAQHGAENIASQGKDPMPTFATGIDSGRRAVELDPDDDTSRRQLADILSVRGRHMTEHGMDPTASFEEAIATYRVLIDHGHADAWQWSGLGNARKILAIYRSEQGLEPDPRFAYREALDAFENAISLNPTWSAPRINSCDVLRQIAAEDVAHGVDPMPDLDHAAAMADDAIRVEPGSAAAINNRALIDLRRSEATTARGDDGEPLLAASLAGFAEVLAHTPNYALAVQNTGNAYLARALDDRLGMRDPAASVNAAVKAYSRRAQIDPSSYWAQRQIAEAWRVAADDVLAGGRDAHAELASADRAVAEALRLKTNDFPARVLEADLTLLSARAARVHATDQAAPRLLRARAQIDALLVLDPRNADGLRVLADVHRERAAIESAAGRDASGAIRDGLDAAARAEMARPGDPHIAIVRGALRLIAARSEKNAASRSSLLAQAREDFDAALARDARLGPDLAPLRAEAARMP